MPRAHPPYPYVEPRASGASAAEIHGAIADLLSQNPQIRLPGGGSLDPLCKALNLDVDYAEPPNDLLLDVPRDVPLNRRAVIWLPRNGRPRQDRLTLAMAIGHWVLQVPATRDAFPDCGIQVLYTPSDPETRSEAWRFASELLMPEGEFRALWWEGKATLTAEQLNVPTQSVYDRAAELMLAGFGSAEG